MNRNKSQSNNKILEQTEYLKSKAMALILYLELSILIVNASYCVKAQSTPLTPWAPFFSVTINSPYNETEYTVASLALDVKATALDSNNAQIFMNYSLDEASNSTIPLVNDHATHEFGILWFTGHTNLPTLSQGNHTLTIITELNTTDINMAGFFYPDYVQLISVTNYFVVNLGNPPIISNLSIENKTYETNNLMLNFTTNVRSSWEGYSLDGQTNVTLTGNATLAGLSYGIHRVTVFANDTLGNMGDQTTIFTLKKVQTEIFVNTIIVIIVITIAGTGLFLYIRYKKNR